MVREARRESQTGYYHVMMRGNNKEMIFSKTAEKQYFIEQLQCQIEKGNNFYCCILPNGQSCTFANTFRVTKDD